MFYIVSNLGAFAFQRPVRTLLTLSGVLRPESTPLISQGLKCTSPDLEECCDKSMFFTAHFSRSLLGRIGWWANRTSVWKAMPAMSDYCLEPFFVYWRRLRAFGIRTVIFFLFAWSMIVEKLMQDITKEKWTECTSTCKQWL